MSTVKRKIVAIGGGECGRINGNGQREPYETAEIDEEIIRLTGKEKPRFLMLAHALVTDGEEAEEGYFQTMRNVYGGLYGCECRRLLSSDLSREPEKVKEYVDWADIVYEGGGDTVALIGLWRRTDFDRTLRSAWESGKVMCGISAGAICWFALGNTDAPGYMEREVNRIAGLGFVDAYFTPHCQSDGRRESVLRSLRHINKVGISASDCGAIAIAGDEYRVLTSAPAEDEFRPYVLRTYRNNGRLTEEELSGDAASGRLADLLRVDAGIRTP